MGAAVQGVAELEEGLELRVLGEPAQEEADEPVISGMDGADDAGYAPAVVVSGGFIPFLHMPVVAAEAAMPGGLSLDRVNSGAGRIPGMESGCCSRIRRPARAAA
ncbi:hypothetical protein [Streptomyces sp. MBT62]|uniref:hypothetical protein n=1 Tax=Streptomyces sp. MBT62 TaxID=2800410 RepID=UPI00190AADDE|nr:hypothetical protein [Streptomyces sp. MBT62]MBK3567074.1 hypothetical protein [Streptomyces sp. MBT62]